MAGSACELRGGSGPALAEQMRSAKADGEDCLKFRASEALDGTSSAAEQM